MTLDPQVQQLFDWIKQANLPTLDSLSPEDARTLADERTPKTDLPPVPMELVAEKAIGRESGFVRCRLYTPRGMAATGPLLIWLHGGGWTVGSLVTADSACRALAAGARCRVLSVGYALAPEHPFPAAVDDAMLVYRTVIGAPGEYGADPARIAVGGDSAGGNLAAVITHLARDEGLARPAFQLLVYPSTDLAGDYPSRRELGEGYLLTATLMDWFTGHYLPDPADRTDPRASPLRFADFTGLPPAYIQTAGYDPLKDEDAAYAAKLADAGVAVEHAHYAGLIHGFFNHGGVVDAARAAIDDAAAALARALHGN